jgi:hypothetical protein
MTQAAADKKGTILNGLLNDNHPGYLAFSNIFHKDIVSRTKSGIHPMPISNIKNTQAQ